MAAERASHNPPVAGLLSTPMDGIRQDVNPAHLTTLKAYVLHLHGYGRADLSLVRGECMAKYSFSDASQQVSARRQRSASPSASRSAGLVLALLVRSPEGTLAQLRRSLPVMTDPADALQDPVTRRAERGQLQRDWIAASAESGRQAREHLRRPLRFWPKISLAVGRTRTWPKPGLRLLRDGPACHTPRRSGVLRLPPSQWIRQA